MGRERRKNEKILAQICTTLREVLFFLVAFSRVNKNSKRFLVELSGEQEEENISAFLSSRREKVLLKVVPNLLQNNDFLV